MHTVTKYIVNACIKLIAMELIAYIKRWNKKNEWEKKKQENTYIRTQQMNESQANTERKK